MKKFSLVLLFVSIASFLSAQKNQRPNVLFILADDMGWRDLSVEGSTFYESPNIDRIANEGVRFTNGYATCQVCSPSRASIMTGKYPARLDITDWIGAAMGEQWNRNTPLLPAIYNHNLDHKDTTLAEAFQSAGYTTFFAGKWHLGSEGSHPDDHGFDINVGGHHKGSPPGGYFSPYDNPRMESGPKGEYLPFRLADETEKFIRQHKDEPFLAYLSFYMVHGPLQTTEALWKKYRDKASAQPKPTERFLIDRTSPVRQVQDHPVYGGMVEAMDTAIGQVLNTLDELGLMDNTIVVFTSDNGGVSAGDGKATSNLPYRGGKGRQWEGGIREPYYIKWAGSPINGTNVDTPVTGTDFFPTLLDLTGLPLIPEQHMDGVSLKPLLLGKSIKDRPLFWHYPHYSNQRGDPSTVIREGDWKLIYYHEDKHIELYNLVTDPGEHVDLAGNYPGLEKAMLDKLLAWTVAVDAKFPTENPNFSSQLFEAERKKTRLVDKPALEKEHAEVLNPDWSPKEGWWEITGN
ncbi:MAG: sulfatase [Verrucomicrobia bacterium]|nr:sulfatase [Verrucomicrobiota bacterium]MDA1065886.1 sulfatase [Verrucomicrobiota bacterium]